MLVPSPSINTPIFPEACEKNPSTSQEIFKVAQELFGNIFILRPVFDRTPELVQQYLFRHLEAPHLIEISKINTSLKASVLFFATNVFNETFKGAPSNKMLAYWKDNATTLSIEEILLSLEFKDLQETDPLFPYILRNKKGFVDKEMTIHHLKFLDRESLENILKNQNSYNYPFLVSVFRSHFKAIYKETLEFLYRREIRSHRCLLPDNFKNFNDALKNNKDFMLIAVADWGHFLKYADPSLKDDEEIVVTAVETNKNSFKYASKRLQDNKEILLTGIRADHLDGQGKDLFRYASQRLQDDEEVVLEIFKNAPWECIHASQRLKNSKELFTQGLQSMRHYVSVLCDYLGEELQEDPEFLLFFLKKIAAQKLWYKLTSFFTNLKLKDNKQFILKVLEIEAPFKIFEHVSTRLQDDEDVALSAVTQDGLHLKRASPRFKNNRTIVLAAVSQNGMALQYASDTLKKDVEVVLAAEAKNGPFVLKFASLELKNNKDFIFLLDEQWKARERSGKTLIKK